VPEVEWLRTEQLAALNIEEQKDLARQIAMAFHEAPCIPLGVFPRSTAYRSNLRDVDCPVMVGRLS
jgi:hypothetical protein